MQRAEDRDTATGRHVRLDLIWSLALIATVVCVALIGLALDGNWPKIARVSLSFAAYSGIFLLWLRRRSTPNLPFYWFASAGAVAGVVSGVVRPQFQPETLVAGVAGAAVLLGGVHWLALKSWRRVRRMLRPGE